MPFMFTQASVDIKGLKLEVLQHLGKHHGRSIFLHIQFYVHYMYMDQDIRICLHLYMWRSKIDMYEVSGHSLQF